jgi:hypothetical protein
VTGIIFSVAEKIVGVTPLILFISNITVCKEVCNGSTYLHCGWTSNPNSRTANQYIRRHYQWDDRQSLFSFPPVDLKTVQDAVDDLSAALAAQPKGGPAATAEKKNRQAALIGLLRRLRRYVENLCGNDLSVLLSSAGQSSSSLRWI